MMRSIRKLLNIINEKIIVDIPNEWTEELVPIHENPTLNEMLKIMYNSEHGNVRLIINILNNNYYAWDADGVLHHDVMNYLDIGENDALALIMYKSEDKEGFFCLEDTELDSVGKVWGNISVAKLKAKLAKLKFFKNFNTEYIWLKNGKVSLNENILEEYYTSLKSMVYKAEDFIIYKNISPREFREAIKQGVLDKEFSNMDSFGFRFIIDTQSGDSYTWLVYQSTHDYVLKKLKKDINTKLAISGVFSSYYTRFMYDPTNNPIKDPKVLINFSYNLFKPLVKNIADAVYDMKINHRYITFKRDASGGIKEI